MKRYQLLTFMHIQNVVLRIKGLSGMLEAVLIKNDVRKGVNFFSSKSDRLVLCKLERTFSTWKKMLMFVLSIFP